MCLSTQQDTQVAYANGDGHCWAAGLTAGPGDATAASPTMAANSALSVPPERLAYAALACRFFAKSQALLLREPAGEHVDVYFDSNGVTCDGAIAPSLALSGLAAQRCQ